MKESEIRDLESKLQRINKLKNTINKFDAFLEDVGVSGKCKEINYEYYAPCKGGAFELDEVGTGSHAYGTSLSARSLGVTDKKFSEWFTSQLKVYIRGLKSEVQAELDAVE